MTGACEAGREAERWSPLRDHGTAIEYVVAEAEAPMGLHVTLAIGWYCYM